jgi:hypothetical protein
MSTELLKNLTSGSNTPSEGCFEFNSSDHIRFQNGQDISGHNYGCNRQIKIEKNISGNIGYTVTILNLDSTHPIWGNNIQMAPKQMKFIGKHDNIIELRGFGYDENALAMGALENEASFAHYGILLLVENNQVERIQLNMYDRNISIVYLK